jgi:hypothetical protein
MILEMANFCVQRLDELEAKFKQLEKEVQALAQVQKKKKKPILCFFK